MRRVFNKKQLIVMWFVGVVVCFFTLQSSIIIGDQATLALKPGALRWKFYDLAQYYAINWFRLSLIPSLLVGFWLLLLVRNSYQSNIESCIEAD